MMLLVLAWLIFIPVIWKKSVVGLMYVSLILIHDYGFVSLIRTDYIHYWAFTAGFFSYASMRVCWHLRNSALDDIAFYLFILSGFALLSNIVTLIMCYLYWDLEALTPIFAGISILSIGAIAGGDSGPRDRDITWDINVRDFINSRTFNILQLVQSKKD